MAPGIGGVMSTGTEHSGNIPQRRRARHQGTRKNHRITISLAPEEHRELKSAARECHLTVAAFVADRALAAARHQASAVAAAGPLREALEDLMRIGTQLHRAGTNFNQAVAALNATGQPPENLPHYARYTADVVHRVDEAVTAVRERLP